MPRRVSLPGAAELFRATDPVGRAGEDAAPVPALRVAPEPAALQPVRPEPARPADPRQPAPTSAAEKETSEQSSAAAGLRRRSKPIAKDQPVRPSGRTRHDEKITVYCSPEELYALEHARLMLRGDFGLSVDRGRMVREAVAVVLADFMDKGEDSILIRRLTEQSGESN